MCAAGCTGRWAVGGLLGGERVSAELAGIASAAVAEVEDALAVELDPTAAAFFDVDNTMMMGASIFHFARGLAARKFFTSRDLASFAWQQVKFRVGGAESHEGMAEAPGGRLCRSSRASGSTRSSPSARRSSTS